MYLCIKHKVNIKIFSLCSRVYQVAKLFLFSPSSGLYSCPLAMTDGAAKLIEVGLGFFLCYLFVV